MMFLLGEVGTVSQYIPYGLSKGRLRSLNAFWKLHNLASSLQLWLESRLISSTQYGIKGKILVNELSTSIIIIYYY